MSNTTDKYSLRGPSVHPRSALTLCGWFWITRAITPRAGRRCRLWRRRSAVRRTPCANGSTGSIIASYWSQSATSRLPRPRRAITPHSIRPKWWPDLNKNASGKPGAVQSAESRSAMGRAPMAGRTRSKIQRSLTRVAPDLPARRYLSRRSSAIRPNVLTPACAASRASIFFCSPGSASLDNAALALSRCCALGSFKPICG